MERVNQHMIVPTAVVCCLGTITTTIWDCRIFLGSPKKLFMFNNVMSNMG